MTRRAPRALGRLVRWGAVGVVLVTALPALVVAWRSYRQEVAVFFPERRPVTARIDALGIDGASAVSFEASGLTQRGWYAPSQNGAAVIVVHGAGGDRASHLAEARALTSAGFGVLCMDGPGHGESAGEIHWSEIERAALRAAVDWVAARGDVRGERIGAFGFSLGGYVLAQVASGDPRLRAVVLAGTPSDPILQARLEHERFWLVSQLPALFALRRGGMDLDVRARDYVARLAPRPLLIVTGTNDGTVPELMARELHANAREPKELYVVAGAGHGDYHRVAGTAYTERLVRFFEASLGEPAAR